MSQLLDASRMTIKTAVATGKYILVKIDANGEAAVAALGERPIGVMERETFAGDLEGTVILLRKEGTIKCVSSGAFARGALVYGRAAGKVDDISTTSAVLIGYAKEAASGANEVVEVIPVG